MNRFKRNIWSVACVLFAVLLALNPVNVVQLTADGYHQVTLVDDGSGRQRLVFEGEAEVVYSGGGLYTIFREHDDCTAETHQGSLSSCINGNRPIVYTGAYREYFKESHLFNYPLSIFATEHINGCVYEGTLSWNMTSVFNSPPIVHYIVYYHGNVQHRYCTSIFRSS